MKKGRQGADRVIHVATDGESYGHHTKWGERTLAYALAFEAQANDLRITNYGEYLDEHPPTMETRIKEGPNGEGTAWSCAHGVGRWYRDCGCHTGGQDHWNQAWRTPLRRALDLLRDYAMGCFDKAASGFFKDPWAARDEFIHVLLQPCEASRRVFFERHALKKLDSAQAAEALTWMDLQRQCMLMYTSCGWFFTDVSGIETVQILKYACRAMDYLKELGYQPPEEEFLKILAQAVSNVEGIGNGADIFRRFVLPSRVSADRMVADLAVTGLVENSIPEKRGIYDFEVLHFNRRTYGNTGLVTGRIRCVNRLTTRVFVRGFAAFRFEGIDFYCKVRNFENENVFNEAVHAIHHAFQTGFLPEVFEKFREYFGRSHFGINELLPDAKQSIAGSVFRLLVDRLSEQYARIYEENRRTLETFIQAGFRLPDELITAAEYTLARTFTESIREQQLSRDPDAYRRAEELAEEISRQGYRVDTREVSEIFSDMITEVADQCTRQDEEEDRIQTLISLLKLNQRLGIKPSLARAQEILRRCVSLSMPASARAELAGLLGMNEKLLGGTSR